MPWQKRTPMELRRRFIEDWKRAAWTMTDLCATYGVSRKTGYQLVHRYLAEGPAGLAERSRRPHRTAPPVAPGIVTQVYALRQRYPTWGARKLLARLQRLDPEVNWPSCTAIHRLLAAGGLVRPAGRRQPIGLHRLRPLRPAWAANDVWTVDFKGDFRLGSGQRCYPLTLRDLATRYTLRCDALEAPDGQATRRCLMRAFAEFGLPACMRSDNGEPFAGPGLAGLSQLNLWWMRLGIAVEQIAPGRPQQNGSHEQFHRVLGPAIRPPAATHRSQQQRFDRVRHEYNEERPHAALNYARPADFYQPSPRPLPRRLPPLEYPGHWEPRRVAANGRIAFAGASIFLSRALATSWVALEPCDDDLWTIYFAATPLARWCAREERLRPLS